MTGGIELGKLEYEQLKAEQLSRISHRDGLLYATLAAYGATAATALSGHPAAWLAAPLAAIVLGWNYLANDVKVSQLGAYIRTELGPRLTMLSGAAEPVFGWEDWHRTQDPGRRIRVVMWLLVDLITFAGVPLGALMAFWFTGPHAAALIASIAEAIAVLAWTLQVHASATLSIDPTLNEGVNLSASPR